MNVSDNVSDVVIVYATYPSEAVAQAAGRELVVQRLAACVNIIPGMSAMYVWEGEVKVDREVVLIAKTGKANADRVVAAITARHPYEIPAVLVIPVQSGSGTFLEWVCAQSRPDEVR